MQAGKLRDYVEVQVKSNKKDRYGARIKEWKKLFGAKANVHYLSGSDLVKAGVSINTQVITVLMRRDSRISESCFLSVNGDRFDIGSIRPANKNRDLIIVAEREL